MNAKMNIEMNGLLAERDEIDKEIHALLAERDAARKLREVREQIYHRQQQVEALRSEKRSGWK
jgi:hypothetical protein